MKSQRSFARLRGRLSAAAALTMALSIAVTAVPVPAFAAPPRVWIDPGHGGSDPGAVANATQEKDTNLDISRMVAAGVKRQGWTVGMTRNSDYFVGLVERPDAAQAFGADIFVSIHSNSVSSMRAVGDMTIYRSAGGEKLGASIMGRLAPLTPYEDIGNQADVRGLAVLRHATMPAVIVELLSVTNADEAAALNDPSAQRRMAEAIVKGMADYYGLKYIPPVATVKTAALKVKPKPEPAVKPKAESTKTPAPAKIATTAVEATPAPAAVATPSPAVESSITSVPLKPASNVTTFAPPAPSTAEPIAPYHPGDLSLAHAAEMDVVSPPRAAARAVTATQVVARVLPFGQLLESFLR